MSKLTDTQKAYDRVSSLLAEQILRNSSSVNDLRKAQEFVDAAFYLLAWGQFEYLIKNEARQRISGHSKEKGVDGVLWRFIENHLKQMSLKDLLKFVFFDKSTILNRLEKDYRVRNDATHDYKLLPPSRLNISEWISNLEEYVSKL